MKTIVPVCILLMSSACAIPAGPPLDPTAPIPAPAPDETIAAVARDVLEEVNRTRLANGRNRLVEDPALTRAAREHSEELAIRRTLDHTSTDPSRRTMTMRIEAVGVTWYRAAENLANTSGSTSDLPSRTVKLWLNSEGHRRNLLEPAFTHTGVGVAIDERGIWYITQLYVLPR